MIPADLDHQHAALFAETGGVVTPASLFEICYRRVVILALAGTQTLTLVHDATPDFDCITIPMRSTARVIARGSKAVKPKSRPGLLCAIV